MELLLCFRFEDGTVSFLDIVALGHGFDALEKIAGTISVSISCLYLLQAKI